MSGSRLRLFRCLHQLISICTKGWICILINMIHFTSLLLCLNNICPLWSLLCTWWPIVWCAGVCACVCVSAVCPLQPPLHQTSDSPERSFWSPVRPLSSVQADSIWQRIESGAGEADDIWPTRNFTNKIKQSRHNRNATDTQRSEVNISAM